MSGKIEGKKDWNRQINITWKITRKIQWGLQGDEITHTTTEISTEQKRKCRYKN